LSKTVKCSHCHLEFNEDVMIKDGEHYFCCNGCQGVFHLLSEQGLDSFYEKAKDVKLAPPLEQFEDSSNFDAPAFYDKFVKVNEDGFCEISLIIEGIHCSACVWLNEKALHQMDGVVEASINFTNNKAHVIWADDVTKLSQIIDMIRAIGYNAYPYDPSIAETHANAQRKDYYLRMAVAIFSSMNIMWIAVAQYAGYFTGITQDMKTILNVAEGVLATPVLFYTGWIFFRGAYYGLKNKTINMDLLVATGAVLTYFYSIYITIMQRGEAYFDSVAMIITFVFVGKFLEVLGKKNAADTIDIMSKNLPEVVKIVKDNEIISSKVQDVKIGDVVVISSGEKVLFDGIIVKGSGSFDESSLTGESDPIYKEVGDNVVSGTISIDADIYFQTTKDFEHSTLSTLIALLQNAMNKKPKIEQIANRLSEYFSAVILSLSIITFFVWWFWPHNFETSFMVAISVIIIACPCALGLATPMATLIGLSLGAKKGIVFKEAAMLETMAKTNVLVLDKTGTLTVGKPEVYKEVELISFDKNLLYSLVKLSKHPISQGIAKYLKQKNKEIESYLLDEYEQIASKGIIATYKNRKILGGNKQLLFDNDIQIDYESKESAFYFVIDNEVVAIYELQDKIKEDAKELLSFAKEQNIDVVMLSGDHQNVVQKVAKELGIDKFFYEQTPKDKASFIEQLHKENKKVVMVGDGVNDILALANADIGIAMGSGSDIAVNVGDVVLLQDSLKSLKIAFMISQVTLKLIKQNFILSLIYNSLTIPLAMAGYVVPFVAAISMSLSSLLVVGNSMRIRYKVNKQSWED